MSSRHTLRLHGCTPEPLMSYLKALGVLRLVSPSRPIAEALGCWDRDVFVLESSAGSKTELDGVLTGAATAPTPILGPWAGGSGFFGKDNRDRRSESIASSSVEIGLPRAFAAPIAAVRTERPRGSRGWWRSPPGDQKAHAPEAATDARCRTGSSQWMDASMALGRDDGMVRPDPRHRRERRSG